MGYYSEQPSLHTEYKMLLEKGVSLSNIRGMYHVGTRWSADIQFTPGTPSDLVKDAVRSFLIYVYGANAIRFTVPQGKGPGNAHVEFIREVM